RLFWTFLGVNLVIKSGNINSVENICVDVVVGCQMESDPGHILNDFNRVGVTFNTKKEASEALNLIIEVANNTRLWTNNGYTPREMFERFEQLHLQKFPEGEVITSTGMNKVASGQIRGNSSKA